MSDNDSDLEMALALSLSLAQHEEDKLKQGTQQKRRSARLKNKRHINSIVSGKEDPQNEPCDDLDALEDVQADEVDQMEREQLEMVLELSRREAEARTVTNDLSTQKKAKRHILATESGHIAITWANMKEFTELYGTTYDGFLVLPPNIVLHPPPNGFPSEHTTLYEKLISEVPESYKNWADPTLDALKWQRRASKQLKQDMKHFSYLEGSKMLPKSVECKLLTERRLLFSVFAANWYPGIVHGHDLTITWNRFKLVAKGLNVTESDLKDLFCWYALDEDLVQVEKEVNEINHHVEDDSITGLIYACRNPIGRQTSCIPKLLQKSTEAPMIGFASSKKTKGPPISIQFKNKSSQGINGLCLTWYRYCRMFDDMALKLEMNGTMHH